MSPNAALPAIQVRYPVFDRAFPVYATAFETVFVTLLPMSFKVAGVDDTGLSTVFVTIGPTETPIRFGAFAISVF